MGALGLAVTAWKNRPRLSTKLVNCVPSAESLFDAVEVLPGGVLQELFLFARVELRASVELCSEDHLLSVTTSQFKVLLDVPISPRC